MVPSTYNKVNEVEEGNAISSFSNIQIDPNSTRSVNTTTQETQLLTKPQEEDAKSVSKGCFIHLPLVFYLSNVRIAIFLF